MKKKILSIFSLIAIGMLFSCASEIENGSKANFDKLPNLHVDWPQNTSYVFNHPCLVHTSADFDYVRNKAIVEQKQPWLMGYNKLVESSRAQKNYQPNPQVTITRPGSGYNVLSFDAAAAYQLALMWKMTGDNAYADASIRVMNAWANTNTAIVGNESILVAGFGGYQYANAAEIMRSYSGWSETDFTKFKKWMVDVLYPICDTFLRTHNGANANMAWMSWDLPAMTTILSIGVVCDDSAKVNQAVDYFYNGAGAGNIANSLVARHKDPDGNVTTFAQSQEMGRDQGHATLNVALHAYFCKMVYNALGIDLFSYNNNAILDLCEYTAKYNLIPGFQPIIPYSPYYSYKEGWHNVVDPEGQGRARPGWELIYNHYKLKGANPYYSKAFARTMRPEGGGNRGTAEADDLGFGTLMYTREPVEAGEDQAAPTLRPY